MVVGMSPDNFGLIAEFVAASFEDVEQSGAISEVVVGQCLVQQRPQHSRQYPGRRNRDPEKRCAGPLTNDQ